MAERILSHYRVLEELSRGGMGIVYRAVDTKLDREVALKLLPPELVADPDRKRRFVQEAKAAAALHHPHIATIFEIDEADDTTFIAMELIRGEKLSDVVRGTPLPLSRVLELATEVAEGLARAHEKGIVHRDLKSANIMLDEDEHAKIIDFGLAKLMEPLGGSGSSDSLEDTALRQTESGKILGTVSYMSPEQARGKTLDHRSDIFSFGIVLYEMLTGRLPFQGPSGVETLNAILKEPMPPLELDASAQDRDGLAELERVIRRCLAKDPEDRYQTTKDLLSELRRVRRDSDSSVTTSVTPAPSSRAWPRWITAAIVVVLGLAALGYFMRASDVGVPQLTNPVQVTSVQGAELYPTWAPEGGRLAYTSTRGGLGNADIWVTQLSGGEPVTLSVPAVSATSDASGRDMRQLTDDAIPEWRPSWSADGNEIAFYSYRSGNRDIWIMSADGSGLRQLTRFEGPDVHPTWSPDGTHLAFLSIRPEGPRIFVVSRDGGEPRLFVDDTNINVPAWSPDGDWIAFRLFRSGEFRTWRARVEGGEPEPLTRGPSPGQPRWSPDGKTIFVAAGEERGPNIWSVSIGDGAERAMTDFSGRPGTLGTYGLATDGDYLYFTWDEDVGDLWVMDVVEN